MNTQQDNTKINKIVSNLNNDKLNDSSIATEHSPDNTPIKEKKKRGMVGLDEPGIKRNSLSDLGSKQACEWDFLNKMDFEEDIFKEEEIRIEEPEEELSVLIEGNMDSISDNPLVRKVFSSKTKSELLALRDPVLYAAYKKSMKELGLDLPNFKEHTKSFDGSMLLKPEKHEYHASIDTTFKPKYKYYHMNDHIIGNPENHLVCWLNPTEVVISTNDTWNASMLCIYNVKFDKFAYIRPNILQKKVLNLNSSSNGKVLIVLFEGNEIRYMDTTQKFKTVCTIILRREKPINKIILLDDNNFIYGTKEGAKVFNIKKGCNVKSFNEVNSNEIHDITISNDKKYVAIVSDDGSLKIFNITDQRPKLVLLQRSKEGKVMSAEWCPWRNNVLVSGVGDEHGTLTIFDINDKSSIINQIKTYSPIKKLNFSSVYKELITIHSTPKDNIKSWTFPGLGLIRNFNTDFEYENVLQFKVSPSGHHMVTCHNVNTICFWKDFSTPNNILP